MAYESNTGLGVHNQYGPRFATGASGVDTSQGIVKQFVWFYDSGTLLDDRFLIPAGSVVLDVNKPASVTAVTVGGTAVQAATWAAPVVAAGAVAVTGAVSGDQVIITYQHTAKPIVVA